jgi:S-adenosylmethionine/arginine decarboxylase-like enzyme
MFTDIADNGAWGVHCILDLYDCNFMEIVDPDNIQLWVEELVDLIDMKPYGEPFIQRFGNSGKQGYTCVQLIETSNICAHFSEEDKTIYVDVFSCKDFDPIDVKEHTETCFSAKTKDCKVIYRGKI